MNSRATFFGAYAYLKSVNMMFLVKEKCKQNFGYCANSKYILFLILTSKISLTILSRHKGTPINACTI